MKNDKNCTSLETKTIDVAIMLMFDGSNGGMAARIGPVDRNAVVDMLAGKGGVISHDGVMYAVPGLPKGRSGRLKAYKVRGDDGYDALMVRGRIHGNAYAVHTYTDRHIAFWLRVACMLCGVRTKAVRVEYVDEMPGPGLTYRVRSLDMDPMLVDQLWDDNVNAVLASMKRLAETGSLSDPVYMICNDEKLLHPFCMPEYVLAFVDKFGPAEIMQSTDDGWTWEPISRARFEKLPIAHKKLN